MRYTFNLKKAYDDFHLYNGYTVYGRGERPRSEYVSPYKENRYIPEHNITRRMCYNKLGQYEDIDESPEHLAKIKKILEIIKNKKVDVALFEYVQTDVHPLEVYNRCYRKEWKLTQEEYDLIKEYLNNDYTPNNM